MSFPSVPIASIPLHGLRTPVGPWAVAAGREGLEGDVTELTGHIELLRKGPHVLARGDISVAARLPCARCGEILDWSMSGPFAVVYSPMSAVPPRPEEDVEGGPLVPEPFLGDAEDVGEYEGDHIDLTQVVREFCVVERPFRILCADLDPKADAACATRWRALAGNTPTEPLSPFAALAGAKTAH